MIPCSVGAFRTASVVVAILCLLGPAPSVHAQEGTLQSIRNDVREGPPPSPAASSPPQSSTPQSTNSGDSSLDSDTESNLFLAGAVVVGGLVTAPIWVPITLSGDDYSHPAYLHQFPYDDTTNPPRNIPLRGPLRRRLRRRLRQPRSAQRTSADQYRIAIRIRRPRPTSGRTPGWRRRRSVMERRLQRDLSFCAE